MTTSTAYHRTFTSTDACHLAGVTLRQLDYWCRLGTITPQVPATGSGSKRGWSVQQILVVAVLARVGGHIPISQLDELAALLLDWDSTAWGDTTLLITPDGVWHADDSGVPAVAVAVNLRAIRREVKMRAGAVL